MFQPIIEFSGQYRFLSNFYMYSFAADGKIWPSNEHWYQAAKSIDEQEIEIIRTATTAGLAKRLGRRVKYLKDGFFENRIEIMRQGLEYKFADTNLCQLLLDTGDVELVEGNTWGDTFWGVCLGVGENHLGKLLMEIRTNKRSL